MARAFSLCSAMLKSWRICSIRDRRRPTVKLARMSRRHRPFLHAAANVSVAYLVRFIYNTSTKAANLSPDTRKHRCIIVKQQRYAQTASARKTFGWLRPTKPQISPQHRTCRTQFGLYGRAPASSMPGIHDRSRFLPALTTQWLTLGHFPQASATSSPGHRGRIGRQRERGPAQLRNLCGLEGCALPGFWSSRAAAASHRRRCKQNMATRQWRRPMGACSQSGEELEQALEKSAGARAALILQPSLAAKPNTSTHVPACDSSISRRN